MEIAFRPRYYQETYHIRRGSSEASSLETLVLASNDTTPHRHAIVT